MEKVDVSWTGCWLWTGQLQPNGYPRFMVGSRSDGTRKKTLAHRWSYEHFKGPIPAGLTIDHLCTQPACVNPEHLEAVPHAINLRRGDTIAARNAQVTHCPQGHPYEGDNLVIDHKGARTCRTCRQTKSRLNYYRKMGWDVTYLQPLDTSGGKTGDVVCPKCQTVLFTNYLSSGTTTIQCSGTADAPHRPVLAMLNPYAA
jgi:hypothetical protein